MVSNRPLQKPDSAARWHRTRRWLYVAIAVSAALAFAGLSALDLVGAVYRYTHASPSGPFSHLVNLSIVSTVALIAVLAVYSHDLKKEVALRHEAEGTAVQLALYDPLTGLPNRRYFLQTFDWWLETAESEGTRLSLVVLDLDRFRSVNDLYGHSGGDLLLQEMARRMRKVVRPPHVVARLGADEFAILIVGGGEEGDMVRTVRRLLKETRKPLQVAGAEITITASIGIAIYPRDGLTREVLLQRADLSMSRAKSGGRNTYASFDSGVDAEIRYRLSLEADLPKALATGAIVPYFQPFVDFSSGRIAGFEVLARWHHPVHGRLGGEVFIPLAEDAGLIDRVFAHILDEACRAAVKWDSPVSIAVNASPLQLGERALVSTVLDSLERSGLPARRLEIEVTENALVQDFPLALEIVSALKSVGIAIALDDFGTGYSNLRHLHEIPIDKIKIDKSFIRHRGDEDVSETVVDLVVALGHSLGLKVTAEGVETLDDALWLKERGCDLGQGFLFSEAVLASEVPALLAATGRTAVGAPL